MHRIFLAMIPFLCLSACVERMVAQEEAELLRVDPDQNLDLDSIVITGGTELEKAAAIAAAFAEAYFTAANRGNRAQTAVNTGVYLAAGSVAVGAIGSASERALSNRAIAGVTLQSVGNNGLSQTSIRNVYKAATRMNCVAAIAKLHSRDKDFQESSLAAGATLDVVKEIRIAARSDLTNQVSSFSTVLKKYTDALKENGEIRTLTVNGVEEPQITKLSAYLRRLGQCIAEDSVKKIDD